MHLASCLFDRIMCLDSESMIFGFNAMFKTIGVLIGNDQSNASNKMSYT